ncbi:hypothetical protein ASG49_13160 [Marmoricola sp. Leaf446]|uniref:hypothetical protein n=1 Tax=Marmoricola sp. Leaf446 TaxID=1736379 RepID=UPI0006FA3386|nr:hypothetical protein [Marmoricola sp. Leaf446]KQT90704.1 hypothetical protein ASG49_13160 [Marmoricola sp. Leaf446]
MKLRGVLVGGVLACLALTGCGDVGGASGDRPFTLPVGPTRWDATAPAWLLDGTLHVGERTVELGDDVDQFALGATGVYWMRGRTLMFTSAEGETQRVEDVGWGNLAVSADRSVFATVDQSRGPTDRYGTHVLQAAAFDTRTGEQLYRTPDEEPDGSDDLADLYSETMPLLQGVSTERLFFGSSTIDLGDGSIRPMTKDSEDNDVFEGYPETRFADGYRVGIRGEGRTRRVAGSAVYGVGVLSPDRTTLFDTGRWPTDAVAYDATTGRQRPIDAPWEHFTLVGWVDDDTFFGVAEDIDARDDVNPLQASQVVRCEVRTLGCTPVSPVIPTRELVADESPYFLVESDQGQL